MRIFKSLYAPGQVLRKLFSAIFVLLIQFVFAQTVETNTILGLNFKFRPPVGWNEMSKDSGLALTGTYNSVYLMPPSEQTCFGELRFSISEITASEKADRNNSLDSTSSDEGPPIAYSGIRESFKYNVGFGQFGEYADTLIQKIIYPVKPFKKKKPDGVIETVLINYVSYQYFPINDTLEILVEFQGRIPETDRTRINSIVSKYTDYFFTTNDTLIDSLLAITSPYRFEAKLLPLDSVTILKTNFKFPVLSGWRYDTTRTSNEIKTNFLKIRNADNTECNNATINLTYRVTPVDNSAKKKEVVRIPLSVILEQMSKPKPKPMSDSARAKLRDSTFANMEQHFYFYQTTTQEPGTDCSGREVVTESLYIYIFSKPDERIQITIAFSYMTDDYKVERDYRYSYYRFLVQMCNSNDFEQFYLNNKP